MPRSGFSAKGLGFTGGSPPVWIDNVLETPVYGVAYSNSVSASDNATYAYTGVIPTLFTFNTSTGTISGTHKLAATGAPTQTFNFSITATNSFGSITQAFTWVISTPFEWTVTSGSYTSYTRDGLVGLRFTANATFVVTNGRREFVYKELIGGGGGGGGGARYSLSINIRNAAGGGGAGGEVSSVVGPNNSPTVEGTYSIVIGAGGAGGPGITTTSNGPIAATNGTAGTSTTFNGFTGGGGGGGFAGIVTSTSVSGSGGGAVGARVGGSGFGTTTTRSGGGGAGAGGNGTSATTTSAGGAGYGGSFAIKLGETVSAGGQGGSSSGQGTTSTFKGSGGGGGYAGPLSSSRIGLPGSSGALSIEWEP